MKTFERARESDRTTILSESVPSCQSRTATKIQTARRERGRQLRSGRSGRPLPQAGSADRIAAMAAFLPPEEQTLMRAVYAQGRSAAEIARLMSKRPRSVQRRVHRLVERCLSPEFVLAAGRASGSGEQWVEPMRSVVRACILHGMTIRRAAVELGLSHHVVRSHRAAARALAGRT